VLQAHLSSVRRATSMALWTLQALITARGVVLPPIALAAGCSGTMAAKLHAAAMRDAAGSIWKRTHLECRRSIITDLELKHSVRMLATVPG
jgi:hypothetical protein